MQAKSGWVNSFPLNTIIHSKIWNAQLIHAVVACSYLLVQLSIGMKIHSILILESTSFLCLDSWNKCVSQRTGETWATCLLKQGPTLGVLHASIITFLPCTHILVWDTVNLDIVPWVPQTPSSNKASWHSLGSLSLYDSPLGVGTILYGFALQQFWSFLHERKTTIIVWCCKK